MITEDEKWPSDSLEILGHCPLCSSVERDELYGDLEDYYFGSPPGKWQLQQCLSCGAAYLDPRPNEKSIHKAYKVYYTHRDDTQQSIIARLCQNRIFLQAYNGRLNLKYGLKRTPANRALGILLSGVPFVEHYFDPLGRQIPAPPYRGARLLDFGCGNGRFMALAEEAGWECTGIDFDPEAVQIANSNGLNVIQGGVPDLENMKGFDLVTMSHVIEHVHDPGAVVSACYNALNPNGMLWIETPNIKAHGHIRFGRYWRGLECPRHLTIFTPNSLGQLFSACGFTQIRTSSRLFINLTTYAASASAMNKQTVGPKFLPGLVRWPPIWDGIKSIFFREHTEFIRISGRKPQ